MCVHVAVCVHVSMCVHVYMCHYDLLISIMDIIYAILMVYIVHTEPSAFNSM